MSWIQGLLITLLPKTWVDKMRTESQTWMVRCPCGYERSVWDLGGVRWKARGNPRLFRMCSKCGQRTWHTIYQHAETPRQ